MLRYSVAFIFWLALVPQAVRADLVEGQPVPRFEAATIDGKPVDSDRFKGKVVLALFWATWCHICTSEMPEFQQAYQASRAKGLEIVAFSLDRDLTVVVDYWRRGGYAFPAAMRTVEVHDAFGDIKGTPTLFLIDRKGVVRLKHLGALPRAELERRLKALL